MEQRMTALLVVWAVVLVAVARAAPRSRGADSPSLVYDQKQKGDYNLQVSVKDVHVIALLSDDVLDMSGDYDYNYDYSDFTIKPKPGGGSTSTSKPQNCTDRPVTAPPSDKDTPPTSATAPSKPPLIPPVSTSTGAPSTTEKASEVAAELQSRPPSSTYKPVEDAPPPPTQNSTAPVAAASLLNDLMPPETAAGGGDKGQEGEGGPLDRIKVQIIQSPAAGEAATGHALHPKVVASQEELAEGGADLQTGPVAQLSETAHYRRCLAGYARDKKGRCRRVRRPGAYNLPFGISRLASNWAALTGATLQQHPQSPAVSSAA